MEIVEASYRYARVNDLAFSEAVCTEVRAAEQAKGITEHRHTQDCYARDFDPIEVVTYYGVEIVPGIGEVVVTGSLATPDEVLKAKQKPVSEVVDPDAVIALLDDLARRRALLDASKNKQTVAKIDAEMFALRELLA